MRELTFEGAGADVLGIVESSNTAAVDALVDRRLRRNGAVERRAKRIVSDVRDRGDAALLTYARTLDGLTGTVEISSAEMRREARRVPGDVRDAISGAARAIRTVAEKQIPRGWTFLLPPGSRSKDA